MNLNDADRKKLATMLEQLGKAVEDLLLTGLTTASETTRQTLNVAFQEASRLKLLRLGGTLRVANEELGRFTRNDPEFSRSRFSFFINRAWMLGKGLARALQANDDAAFDQLNFVAVQTPIKTMEMVALGVAKKVTTNVNVGFDFRLRVLKATGNLQGQRLSWSRIYAVTPGVDMPAEAYLHLPQKLKQKDQKFTAFQFLEGKSIKLEDVAVTLDDFGGGRLAIGEQSTVVAGDAFGEWEGFQSWNAPAASERIKRHQPGPFDLDVEMQEEVILEDWTIDKPIDEDSQWVYPITCREVAFAVSVSKGAEGKSLKKQLDDLIKKKTRPPLFGLLHYEKCRLMLQPLTLFAKDGPVHLMISEEKIDRKELLRALKF